ncbi:metallophosphoesterase family protein [Paenibacillus paridis]|uniref:metallophosphoesterase family protein n=1 Tax=Paenibacillus paridis TaxID=2583376 RepID=UPI00111D7D9A|nr:metallophosphoesterase [Paenibacillus paridis]
MRFKHLPTINAKQTLIEVEGLASSATILHLTDAHLNETDIRKDKTIFMNSIKDYGFDALETRKQFETALTDANEKRYDFVVLTGDIINGATAGNLDYLETKLQELRSPYLYTLGNHDWEYPLQPWNEATRAEQYPKFNSFTNDSPAYQASLFNGINLLTIDNSTYQITKEQLHFTKKQLANGLPTLLFIHIPIYIPGLLPDVMKQWGAPIMMAAEGWDKSLQSQWKVAETTAETTAFYHLLLNNPHHNLIGIFCGHVHFAHTDAFGKGSYQYVTSPGFAGGYRLIHLLPKT